MPITRVPNSPDFVEGVINLRGQITTVVNLKKLLGYYDSDEDLSKKKIIIAEVRDEIVRHDRGLRLGCHNPNRGSDRSATKNPKQQG